MRSTICLPLKRAVILSQQATASLSPAQRWGSSRRWSKPVPVRHDIAEFFLRWHPPNPTAIDRPDYEAHCANVVKLADTQDLGRHVGKVSRRLPVWSAQVRSHWRIGKTKHLPLSNVSEGFWKFCRSLGSGTHPKLQVDQGHSVGISVVRDCRPRLLQRVRNSNVYA